ncbi:cytochrome c-type biogenesis protein [Salegentibacter echinorum]|uniref:Cytochrome c-type biogenesis protein n=1 Tax=Salegentibacter echinorum TaxID=1073325 RepID=A0A1M5KGP9_SALEC|nr:cytochrome c biogenesis protein CcdA [Salegentibacter echinorum]SHG51353.1 cytochrome c-type biogenesis protein [Salegentibacter echinorum]
MEFIGFSFLQGVLAFLAPCAVALLPGYILAFISRNPESGSKVSTRLARGFKLASLSILGILLIYSIAGAMIVMAGQFLKDYMKWITVVMGAILILLGILMLLGKSISFSFNIQNSNPKTEAIEAFIFGIGYAIGALGCLFPLFLIVATQAMAAETIWEGSSYILAYFSGISIMMILTILLAIFAKNLLLQNLRKILPYMEKITAVLLVFAGVYVIYYQMSLF